MKKLSHRKSKTKLTNQNIVVILICIIVPIIFGVCSGDLIIGVSLLATGFLASYLSSLQRRTGYIFGLINALLIAYIGLINNFYGTFFINAFIFAPLEIFGFVSWARNSDAKQNVKIRRFTPQKSIILIGLCAIGSVLLGYLLTMIPSQQMAFLDSTICCIDICALIIMNFRYVESWWLWVISGALSIVMWGIALSGGGSNAFMRLFAAIGFTLIDLYGLIKWSLKTKNKKP